MNNLLGIFVDIFLPIIFLILGIIAAIIIYKKTSKKYKGNNTPSPEKNKVPQVKLKEQYCTEDEMKFLEALHKSLPRECISFPHVGLAKIIEPKNNLVDFNNIASKHVDICVFLRKTMQPILIIDLFQQSPAAQQLKKFDNDINSVLKEVKIPVLHKQIQQKYNTDALRMEVLKAMNNDTVAYLKDINMGNIVNN